MLKNEVLNSGFNSKLCLQTDLSQATGLRRGPQQSCFSCLSFRFGISPLLEGSMSTNCGTQILIETGNRAGSVKCIDVTRRYTGNQARITLTRDTIAPSGGYEYGYCWTIYSTGVYIRHFIQFSYSLKSF